MWPAVTGMLIITTGNGFTTCILEVITTISVSQAMFFLEVDISTDVEFLYHSYLRYPFIPT